MSRLIVKNLPKKITEEKLRTLFSEKGTVTDVQLKYTKDGVFRQFAFIGFQTVEEANTAVEYFNNSCIKATKITVEPCAALGDSTKPKSWSKYAADSSAFKKLNKTEQPQSNKDDKVKLNNSAKEQKSKHKEELQEIIEKYKDDPLFVEFMESHAPKGTKPVWGNDSISDLLDKLKGETKFQKNEVAVENDSGHSSDDEDNDEGNDDDDDSEDTQKKTAADNKISDLEYMKTLMKKKSDDEEIMTEHVSKPRQKMEKKVKEKIQLFMVKVRGLSYSTKKKDIKTFFKPLVPYTIRLPPKIKGFAYVGFKTEKEMRSALNKDRSFLAGKRLFVFEYHKHDGNEEDNSKEQGVDDNRKWKQQEDALKTEEDISESGRLFVRNLPYTITEDELQKHFEQYGPVSEINLPIDKITRKLKGFGVITYLMPEHAIKAFSELDGTVFGGRMLHLLPGKAKTTPDESMEGLTFQQKKALKLKKSSGSSHNWNTLFLGQNAIADVVATNYGTSKEHVLDDNAAVRLALGETQIVADIKKFLEESGVSLDAFNRPPTKRSKTVILAKNLPAHTTCPEITIAFKKYGLLGRVVLPPSGVTALIEFLEPSEARQAFMKLAYSKFKNVPLYLEWAPENTFLQPYVPSTKPADKDKEFINLEINKKQEAPSLRQKIEEPLKKIENEDDDYEPEENTTLYIKNLNFETRENAVIEHFKECGKIHCVTVATKKDPNNAGERLSMGYGFIQFKRKSSADNCMINMQQTLLDGKSIELKRSEKVLSNQQNNSKKVTKAVEQTGTKLLVRNVPFQANRNELLQIFQTFGEIKSLRLPKKMTPGEDSHRGFAFVDYQTKSDAKQAFDALCQSTHLYGRRLVLEWAATEENVEDIRKRTAKHFHQSEQSSSKKALIDATSIGLQEKL